MDKSPELIFIVEDEPSIQELIRIVLHDAGYHAVVTPNIAELDARLQSDVPRLLIMDLRLGGMSGYKAALRLKHDERYQQIPIILISADQNIEKYAGSADAYLKKPFAIAELTDLVKRLLSLPVAA